MPYPWWEACLDFPLTQSSRPTHSKLAPHSLKARTPLGQNSNPTLDCALLSSNPTLLKTIPQVLQERSDMLQELHTILAASNAAPPAPPVQPLGAASSLESAAAAQLSLGDDGSGTRLQLEALLTRLAANLDQQAMMFKMLKAAAFMVGGPVEAARRQVAFYPYLPTPLSVFQVGVTPEGWLRVVVAGRVGRAGAWGGRGGGRSSWTRKLNGMCYMSMHNNSDVTL